MMKIRSAVVLSLLSAIGCAAALAQTLFVPGGSVGNISSSNVGIGTTNPQRKLDVEGGGMRLAFGSMDGGYIEGYTTTGTSLANLSLGTSTDFAGSGDVALYTTTAKPLRLGTNGTERLTILSGGNVGIGTTTPAAPLNVYTSGQQTARFDASDSSGGFVSFFDSSGSVTRGYLGYGQTLFNGSASITSADFGIRSQGGIAFGSIGNVFQYITPGGNVGIGTTSPTNKLEVAKDFTYNNFTTGALRLSAASSSSRYIVSGYDNTLNAGVIQSTEQGVGQTSLLLNPNGGNVGIGTTTPGTYKLAVNGPIHAKEVIVDTGWSDFVFDDGYKLPALSEVEQRIKAEHHLPGIPSAREVAEHGIPVGEMQSKLLAKIEELTLHVIEQERKIAAQERRMQHLEDANRQLRVQLKP